MLRQATAAVPIATAPVAAAPVAAATGKTSASAQRRWGAIRKSVVAPPCRAAAAANTWNKVATGGKLAREAKSRFNIGLVYVRTGNYAKARESLERAQACYLELFGADARTYNRDVLLAVAAVHETLGDCRAAEAATSRGGAAAAPSRQWHLSPGDHYEEARRVLTTATVNRGEVPDDLAEMLSRIEEKIRAPTAKTGRSVAAEALAAPPAAVAPPAAPDDRSRGTAATADSADSAGARSLKKGISFRDFQLDDPLPSGAATLPSRRPGAGSRGVSSRDFQMDDPLPSGAAAPPAARRAGSVPREGSARRRNDDDPTARQSGRGLTRAPSSRRGSTRRAVPRRRTSQSLSSRILGRKGG